MERQKRPFYIIAHNPNTIQEAREYLDKGVNALEPDIVHADGRFYVSHQTRLSYEGVLTVEEYLQQLKALLLTRQYNLALIIWDIKNTDFDPNHFLAIVKESFSGSICNGVAMLVTHADDHDFINLYNGGYDNVGIGLDESNTAPYLLHEIFKKRQQQHVSYADGITTLLNKPGVYENITDAQYHRHQYEPDSFKFIYTWVLSKKASMRKYLDTCIDGIFVDLGAVRRLKKLVTTEPYNGVYELAKNGFNPFTAAPLPKYLLSIKTKDAFLAGTDARILFTLTGSAGQSLKSLPYNANRAGQLERGSTSFITIEGVDLGQIKSLTVEALTDGIGAAWWPEAITVESKSLRQKVHFIFDDQDAQAWITKERGTVIKPAVEETL